MQITARASMVLLSVMASLKPILIRNLSLDSKKRRKRRKKAKGRSRENEPLRKAERSKS